MQILLLLVVGLMAVKPNQAVPHSTSRDFNEIDSYLINAVDSDHVETNMAKAEEWLPELEKQGSSSVLNALRELLKLKTILSKDDCDLAAYEILAKNDRLTNNVIFYNGLKRSPRRVDMIVQHYAEKHSDICIKEWPQILAHGMSELSYDSNKYVLKLADHGDFSSARNARSMAYYYLRKYLDFDPDHQKKAAHMKYKYQKKMVTNADFRRYLLDPCKELRKKVSNQLYEPIRFDIDTLRRRELVDGEEFKDFRTNRKAMEYCEYVINNSGKIWDGIYNFMEYERTDEEDEIRRAKKEHRDHLRSQGPVGYIKSLLPH